MEVTPPFNKLLVANRGEIAIRLFRAATELRVPTVGIYSYEDRFAQHRIKADEAYQIGTPGKPMEAYLGIEEIVNLAVAKGVDAIHPGYGFLSENPEFAQKCLDAGIKFIGPTPEQLEAFGDKVKARSVAINAHAPLIPGSDKPIGDFTELKQTAREIGYPVTLKAVSGGGGKGIRMVGSEAELEEAFERARSEAKTSFGRADIYLEKKIVEPKHIEVQIVGDEHGNIVHLFDRDCSVQRRHQKVVELAPACAIKPETKTKLYEAALNLTRSIKYQGLGTVEFLVDHDENIYFLEVNPRVQVEHTVTEMVTGIDLIHTSIMIAAGKKLSDPEIGIESQDSITCSGVAIQCRVTTEDPQQDFLPDTGRIIAYRPATGFGVRLDDAQGVTGGEVTPYYDSLLVKVTALGRNLELASQKMFRSLSEFRIRGVKHNIPLLKNVVTHENFLNGKFTTNFFNDNPDLFNLTIPRDRATKLLRYIAHASVNNPHGFDAEQLAAIKSSYLAKKLLPKDPSAPQLIEEPPIPEPRSGVKQNLETAKNILDKEGPVGLRKWIAAHNNLLVTDTTMRDAHQSLFATRLRSRDILRIAPTYQNNARDLFSLEVWGGATFDTSYRFLKEDPWERLYNIRQMIPDILLQMLMRGDNAVGYTNYPSWLIRDFIKEAANTGLDIFRIFDCLNQPDKMEIAVDEVKKHGAVAEVCICYTGDVSDVKQSKYNINYYTQMAKTVEKMGADIICIKDMAGLLRPAAARLLINSLKETTDLPIHLHTHDTSGAGVAMLLEAAKAGCDIVDAAVSSMSGLTSQPSMNALIASMRSDDDRCPNITLDVLDELSRYWQDVRQLYKPFDPGVQSTSTEVYEHEIPGGQYSNLFYQAQKVGIRSKEFHELTRRYKEVNELFGNIIKVTPSSKVVGDFALLLQKQNLTATELMETKPKLDYPDSVVGFLKGHLGTPLGGFPAEVRELVLGENPPPPKPVAIEENDSFEKVKAELEDIVGHSVKDCDVLSYRLYPKVFLEYINHLKDYGKVEGLATTVFFYGLKEGDSYATDLDPGKTIYIDLGGVSEPNANGSRRMFFNLNGFPRRIDVFDEGLADTVKRRPMADSKNPLHIGAQMPGKVLDVKVKTGETVKAGQLLMVTESMKMEYAITAKSSGSVAAVHVQTGEMVQPGDLLVEFSN